MLCTSDHYLIDFVKHTYDMPESNFLIIVNSSPKYAIAAIKKKLGNQNPHVVNFALQVLIRQPSQGLFSI
jgi:hypothetical protein